MNTVGSCQITAGGAKVPDNDNYNEEITYENGTLIVKNSGGDGSSKLRSWIKGRM